MRRLLLLLSAPLLLSACGKGQTAPTSCNTTSGVFKSAQLKSPTVENAYKEKEGMLLKLLTDKGICPENLQLYIRVFKADKKFEIWGKNKTDATYQLLKVYDVCKLSGTLGPKRKEGDKQVPEGFYYINDFNPNSRFLVSLGVSYPNKADRILGGADPGNDIYIHGSCCTLGCLPMTDDVIKELYVLCVEAKNSGQEQIPIHIFPSKLIAKLDTLGTIAVAYKAYIPFWKSLKPAYDYFEKYKKLPAISIDAKGNYIVSR